MHIAVFLYGLTGGGATRRVVTLAEGWAEAGHRVSLLVVDPRGPLRKRVEEGPLALVALDFGPLSPLVRRLSRRKRLLLAPGPLASVLSRTRPDVFLSAANHAHLPAIRAARRVKVPLVLRLSNHLSASHRGRRGAGAWLSRWRLARIRRRYREAQFAVAVSRAVRDDFLALVPFPPERTAVVHNPVEAEEIARLAREPVDHPWFAERRGPLILGAGRLAAQKDFATLIRAFALLRARVPARLVILGEGKERARLARLVAELGLTGAVDLAGFKANPWAYMARADLFVLSSRWEGLPGVLLEALAVGCPVVSTDCPGGAREVLAGGRYGPLVPVGDARALAEAMHAVLLSPPRREELRRRAEAFGVERAVRAYLEVFEKVRREAR